MLRNFALHCRKAYTCTCLMQSAAQSFNTRGTPHLSSSLLSPTYFSTSAVQWGGGKLTGEKAISRMLEAAQEAKIESIDAGDVDIEGLTEAGVMIPTLETHAMLIDGVRYDELPIVHIKAGLNNTLLKVTDFKGGQGIASRTCGLEGFKGSKRKTTVAAQATAYSIGTNVRRKHGIKNVRVVLKGIGVGREASLKGLQMSGLNIVSLTDNTPIVMSGRRPRKPKRH